MSLLNAPWKATCRKLINSYQNLWTERMLQKLVFKTITLVFQDFFFIQKSFLLEEVDIYVIIYVDLSHLSQSNLLIC